MWPCISKQPMNEDPQSALVQRQTEAKTSQSQRNIIKLRKVKQKQNDYPHVIFGNQQLENFYSFISLCSEIAGDEYPDVLVKHRTDIRWGRFGEYRKVLTSTKLNVSCRIRLFAALIGSTILHGSKCCCRLPSARYTRKQDRQY